MAGRLRTRLIPKLSAVLAKMQRETRGKQSRPITPEEREEWLLCSPKHGVAGFRRWSFHHAYVEDERIKQHVPFRWFEGQELIAEDLVSGQWLIILKGRQLGVTWLCAAYCLWRITYSDMIRIVVINQEKIYAEDFILKVRSIYDRLPAWSRKRITTDNKQQLAFAYGSNRGLLRAVVGSAKAGRSMAGDLVIVDEASRVPELDATLQAIGPILDTTGGQLIQLSSSAGPQGQFYESWRETYGEAGELVSEDGVGPSGYKPIFLHYRMRPGRDEKWEATERAKLDKISPVAFRQEHPDTPEEAWEYAAGRVYSLFRRDRHVGDIEIPTTADLYRAIDWGQTKSAQVFLWIAHIPGPSALLISPECPNTIREMFAYRWDPDKPEDPLKTDDHCPDALRYAIMHFNLRGVVYVYREFYEKDSVAKGWTPMSEIKELHELSGWIKKDLADGGEWVRGRRGEYYKGTVADRSWPKMISLFNEHNCEVAAHDPIRGRKGPKSKPFDPPLKETLEGIRVVSGLIDGTINLVDLVPVRREIFAQKILAQDQTFAGEKVAAGLQERAIQHEARRLLKAMGRKAR